LLRPSFYTVDMTNLERTAFVALTVVLMGCASPQSRIKSHQAAFDSYPPEVQRKIREGRADVGFTREQVTLALGKPDRRDGRKDVSGVQDVWIYGVDSSGPRFGLGFGMGTSGPGITGIGIGAQSALDSGRGRGERVRVVFQNDAVISVENRR